MPADQGMTFTYLAFLLATLDGYEWEGSSTCGGSGFVGSLVMRLSLDLGLLGTESGLIVMVHLSKRDTIAFCSRSCKSDFMPFSRIPCKPPPHPKHLARSLPAMPIQ